MLFRTYVLCALSLLAWLATAAADLVFEGDIEEVNYSDINDPDFALRGYLSVPKKSMKGPLPAVVILPDWDNVNDYEKIRADMLADQFGYIGFTADIYGVEIGSPNDLDTKKQQATYYRTDNPELFLSRIQSAIEAVKSDPRVDSSKIAIIGYCLGGSGVMMYSFANVENSDIVGAVSFHGGLVDNPIVGDMAAPLLVLSGGEDDAGSAVEDLEAALEEANATWQITRYSGVVHGFTKFGSDAYNEWVDKRSWSEMASFLKERFGQVEYGTMQPSFPDDYTVDSEQTKNKASVWTVEYDDNGFALQGYMAFPPNMKDNEQRPALVLLPDWDGVNGPTGYEASRAVLAAREGGFVVFVADIYGTEFTNVEDIEKKRELATFYRADPPLFVGRIQAGIDQVLQHPNVDTENIFMAGYCFGGTGVIDYAFSEGALSNVKAVVPLHGGLNPLRAVQTEAVQPYVLIHSGGIDDAHGNPTELEDHLDDAQATWEISRYSNAAHGFTKWDAGAYQALADSRSWWSMMSLFNTMAPQAKEKPPKKDKSMKSKKAVKKGKIGKKKKEKDGKSRKDGKSSKS